MWRDTVDNFDYSNAAKSVVWPETWHITGVKDLLLGHAEDVKSFINESNPKAKLSVLSIKAGNQVDYGHIDILTHKLAVKDHFPIISAWLKKE